MPAPPSTLRQFTALAIALLVLIAPLAGMALVGMAASAYIHLVENILPALLALGLILIGGTTVGPWLGTPIDAVALGPELCPPVPPPRLLARG